MDTKIENALHDRAAQALDWLKVSAAYWSEAGVHPDLGFREELDMAGQPTDIAATRVRVQARQTYCFALVSRLAATVEGFDGERARDLMDRGVAILSGPCLRPDGLVGRRLSHDGRLVDQTADLYDNAFALLALSTAAALGSDTAREAADRLAAAIDQCLERPDAEAGYFEILPDAGIRLQNPHMHLFEASLVHHEVTGSNASLARARAIERLMETRFLTQDGALREIFSPRWGPLEGDRLETGHQYEWVWLLHERARIDGEPMSTAADGLYESALSLTADDGAIYLEHHLSGALKDSTRRCWSVTEALKAHLARYEAGDRTAGARAIAAYDQLQAEFLGPAPVHGGWIDRLDGYGNAISLLMPASTGYHVYLALAELGRVSAIDPAAAAA